MDSDSKVLVHWLKYLAEHAPQMEIEHAISVAEEIDELYMEALMNAEALALLAHAGFSIEQAVGKGRPAIEKAVKHAMDCHKHIKSIPTDGNAIDELMAKWEKEGG